MAGRRPRGGGHAEVEDLAARRGGGPHPHRRRAPAAERQHRRPVRRARVGEQGQQDARALHAVGAAVAVGTLDRVHGGRVEGERAQVQEDRARASVHEHPVAGEHEHPRVGDRARELPELRCRRRRAHLVRVGVEDLVAEVGVGALRGIEHPALTGHDEDPAVGQGHRGRVPPALGHAVDVPPRAAARAARREGVQHPQAVLVLPVPADHEQAPVGQEGVTAAEEVRQVVVRALVPRRRRRPGGEVEHPGLAVVGRLGVVVAVPRLVEVAQEPDRAARPGRQQRRVQPADVRRERGDGPGAADRGIGARERRAGEHLVGPAVGVPPDVAALEPRVLAVPVRRGLLVAQRIPQRAALGAELCPQHVDGAADLERPRARGPVDRAVLEEVEAPDPVRGAQLVGERIAQRAPFPAHAGPGGGDRSVDLVRLGDGGPVDRSAQVVPEPPDAVRRAQLRTRRRPQQAPVTAERRMVVVDGAHGAPPVMSHRE